MFGKIITEMLTPLTSCNDIDLDVLQDYLSYLSQNYTDSLIINGELSEFDKLTYKNKLAFVEKVVALKSAKMKILYLIDRKNTFLDKIDKYIDGYIVKNNPQDIKQISNKPFMIYNPDLNMINKYKIQHIILTKENITLITRYKKQFPDVNIYINKPEFMFTGLIHGIVTPMSNLYGDTIHLLMQLIKMKEYELAHDLLFIYKARFSLLENHSNKSNIFKSALSKIGIGFKVHNIAKKELLRFIGV